MKQISDQDCTFKTLVQILVQSNFMLCMMIYLSNITNELILSEVLTTRDSVPPDVVTERLLNVIGIVGKKHSYKQFWKNSVYWKCYNECKMHVPPAELRASELDIL